jgi:hypothetical protein
MSYRVCFLLLVLCLCSLAGAAVTPPAAPVAAPAVAVAAQPAAVPAWLAPAPNHSVQPPADLAPAFIPRNCETGCEATNKQCQANCHGNSICIQDCIDAFGCCHNACSGLGCP